MKLFPFITLACFSLSLYASMGSSISVPVREHLKYTFGNHKNHPVQKLEERQYLRSLAPISENEMKNKLSLAGYVLSSIKLCDRERELLYQASVTDNTGKKLRLFIDPANGSILKMESLK